MFTKISYLIDSKVWHHHTMYPNGYASVYAPLFSVQWYTQCTVQRFCVQKPSVFIFLFSFLYYHHEVFQSHKNDELKTSSDFDEQFCDYFIHFNGIKCSLSIISRLSRVFSFGFQIHTSYKRFRFLYSYNLIYRRKTGTEGNIHYTP